MIYTIDQIREKIMPIALKYKLPAVYVFGSYARGEATVDSDIDILIDESGAEIDGLFAFGGMYNDFVQAVGGKPVSLLTMHELEEESTTGRIPWIVESIAKDRVKIYG